MNVRLLAPIAAALGALALAPSLGHSQGKKPKGPPACGAKFLPFYKGQVFEYEWIAPEGIEDEETAAAPKGAQSDWPLTIKIAVAEISGGKTSATIKLTETYRKRVIETTIKCDEDGFRIDPNSFFFVGEIGGGVNMKLTNVKQDQAGLPAQRDFRTGIKWTSYITADVTREPGKGVKEESITNGKVEIDRELELRGKEDVNSGIGNHRAFTLVVELGQRAAVEPAMDKWRELPAEKIKMWFANGLGLVRVHNRHGHGWMLKGVTYGE